MNDSCCRKKQVENAGDQQIERCVNPKSQVYLNVVNNSFCGLCPVKVACHKNTQTKVHPAVYMPNYPFCENRIADDQGTAVCSVTNLPVTVEQCRSCDAETRDRVASLGDKLVGYASAIKRWVASGRPTRTEEEVKAIFDDHCNKCEMYDRDKHSCKNCGCSLALTGNPLTNKLAMGTEHCPLGRW